MTPEQVLSHPPRVLTQAQREFYFSEGYLLLPKILPAEWIQRLRAATAECVNALARSRGLVQLPVRSQDKARSLFLLHALTHNCLRAHTLRATLGST